jgi:hypothetical protein
MSLKPPYSLLLRKRFRLWSHAFLAETFNIIIQVRIKVLIAMRNIIFPDLMCSSVVTNVSNKNIATIFRVEHQCKQEAGGKLLAGS